MFILMYRPCNRKTENLFMGKEILFEEKKRVQQRNINCPENIVIEAKCEGEEEEQQARHKHPMQLNLENITQTQALFVQNSY